MKRKELKATKITTMTTTTSIVMAMTMKTSTKSEIMTTVIKRSIFAARNFKSLTYCVLPNLVELLRHGKHGICTALDIYNCFTIRPRRGSHLFSKE